MPEILESLFGSKSRSRLLRFFVLNPGKEITMKNLKTQMNTDGRRVRADINVLLRIEFITQTTRKGEKYFTLNESFPYYIELRNLFVKANTYPQCKELKKINDIGRVKLILVSGIFLNYDKSRVDVLIVCDDMSRTKLAKAIGMIESEVGKEVRYMTMTSEELTYRLDMMDRFLIDVLSAPHDIIVNKIPKLQKFILNLKQ
jgi:predicted nucleotidyltransferase